MATTRNYQRNTARTKNVRTEHDIFQAVRAKLYRLDVKPTNERDVAERMNALHDQNTDQTEFYGS